MKRVKLTFLAFLIISLTFFLSGCFSTNQPPTATFTTNTNNLEVTFDASGSSDPDGSIASYDWDFGNGSTGSGVSVTHTFDSSGTYNVELTVTDNGGAANSISEIISVSSDSSQKLEILNWKLEKGTFDCAKVVGEVKNVSGEKIDTASVAAKFFDANGKRLEIMYDMFFDLNPGVTTDLEMQTTVEYSKVDHADVYVDYAYTY